MTDEEFDRLARSLPEVTFADHHGRGAYKVAGKKIFAGPSSTRQGRGILKLTPDQQEMLCEAEPAIFRSPGAAWGAQGWTEFTVSAADEATALSALWTAWRNVAPRSLLKQYP